MADAELLDLIGKIYDAAIDPALWHVAMDAIRARFNFYNAMLSLIDVSSSRGIVNVAVNVPAQFVTLAVDPSYVSEIVDLWGGPAMLGKLVIEEPMVLSASSSPETWVDNLYYRDFAAPQHIVDVVAIGLLRDRKISGDLAFGRHEDFGYIGDTEVEGLRVLAPHLRRAAMISGILATNSGALATFEAALEATPSGVVLVNRDMAIVHANGVAQRMLGASDPIRSVGGKLGLSLEMLPGQLSSAVEAAAVDAAAIGRRGLGIPTRRADGSPLVVHVLPLMQRALPLGLAPRAVAAVFVADTSDGPGVSADALGLLFDLTPAEARIFELTVAGRSSQSVTETLGIAATTLKSHMRHIFEKTGRHSKAELVRLAHDIALPR